MGTRSYTLRNLTNDKGLPLVNVWCRAYNADSGALVETEYTDSSGNVAFTALPDDANVNVCAVWGNNVRWMYDLFWEDADIDDLSISKLTAGNITVIGTITTGKFQTAASPNPRIEISSTLIAGYSDATTKQFYLQASDGVAYAGAGAITLNSSGIMVNGATIYLRDGSSNTRGYLAGTSYGPAMATTSSSYGVNISALGTYPGGSIAGLIVLEAQALKLPMVNGDHASPAEGYCWYDYSNHVLKYRDNSAIQTVAVV